MASPAPTLAWSSLVPDAAAPPKRGGMGTVFKARWERRGLDVAVKLLRGSELSPAEYAEAAGRLEREAQALRLASDGGANRFVVALYGVARGAPTPPWRERLGAQLALFESQGDDGGGAAQTPAGELFGLVMAWQDGGTLAARLHGGAVRWAARTRTPERLLLLERVAEGVALLHSAAPTLVVHGDIKGENVLLTAEGEPRLSDFGLAEIKQAVTSSPRSVAAASASNRDKAGGTWPYMAPELYKRRDVLALKVSPQTDVYALATLCWEVLVGERPWAGATEADRLADIRDGAILDFARLPGDVPAELRALLERGMALDRAARLSAREICEGLRAARKALESGRFDIFLSHAWDREEHAPATTFVLHALRGEGRRVWVDKEQLGRAMGPCMRAGVAASAVVVALVSRKYAASANCMLELREARDGGKTIIACLVEPEEKWWPPTSAATDTERELAAAVNTREYMFADLRRACAAGGWADPLPASLLSLLNAPAAAPMLLKLVADELFAQGAEQRAEAERHAADVVAEQRAAAERAARQVGMELSRTDARTNALTELGAANVMPARAVALLREFAGDLDVGIAAAMAICNAAVSDTGRAACEAAGAAPALVALSAEAAVRGSADAARWVAQALANIAASGAGQAACVSAGAAPALVALFAEASVRGSASASQYIAWALGNIAISDAGRAACEAAGAAPALVALSAERAVRGSADAVESVAWALANIAERDAARAACVAAGAAPALVALSAELDVCGSSGAARWVAQALANIAVSDTGRAACEAAGAAPALVALSAEAAVRGSASASQYIAWALGNIAVSDAGRAACEAAGAAPALVALSAEPAVRGSADAVESVAWALANIAERDAGKAACVAAGAVPALVALSTEPAVRGSADAAQYVAHALNNIAWNNAAGRAACASAGAHSALADLALAPAVKASAAAAEWVGKALASTDAKSNALAELGAVGVAPARAVALLREFAGDLDVGVAAAKAIRIAAASDNGRAACVAAGAAPLLVALSAEPAVRGSANAGGLVALALAWIAMSDAGQAACVSAGAVPALVALSAEPAVRNGAEAARRVAQAFANIANGDAGRAACVAAGAARALVALSAEPAVRDSANALKYIAWALVNIAASDAGRAACVVDGAVLALVALSAVPTVHGSADVTQYIARALANIAGSDAGRAACVTASAVPALVALSAAQAVRGSAGAAQWVATAFVNIAASDAGRAACEAAGATPALVALAAAPAVKANAAAADLVAAALARM